MDWFGHDSSTLHLSADVNVDTLRDFGKLLSKDAEGLSWNIAATAIGLESIEFQERALKKGVAVTELEIFAQRTVDENLYMLQNDGSS